MASGGQGNLLRVEPLAMCNGSRVGGAALWGIVMNKMGRDQLVRILDWSCGLRMETRKGLEEVMT